MLPPYGGSSLYGAVLVLARRMLSFLLSEGEHEPALLHPCGGKVLAQGALRRASKSGSKPLL